MSNLFDAIDRQLNHSTKKEVSQNVKQSLNNTSKDTASSLPRRRSVYDTIDKKLNSSADKSKTESTSTDDSKNETLKKSSNDEKKNNSKSLSNIEKIDRQLNYSSKSINNKESDNKTDSKDQKAQNLSISDKIDIALHGKKNASKEDSKNTNVKNNSLSDKIDAILNPNKVQSTDDVKAASDAKTQVSDNYSQSLNKLVSDYKDNPFEFDLSDHKEFERLNLSNSSDFNTAVKMICDVFKNYDIDIIFAYLEPYNFKYFYNTYGYLPTTIRGLMVYESYCNHNGLELGGDNLNPSDAGLPAGSNAYDSGKHN